MRTSSPVPGRSACHSTGARKRTHNSSNSSAWSLSRNYCTGSTENVRSTNNRGVAGYVEPIHLRDEHCRNGARVDRSDNSPHSWTGDEHGGKVRPAAHAGWTSGLAGYLRPGHDDTARAAGWGSAVPDKGKSRSSRESRSCGQGQGQSALAARSPPPPVGGDTSPPKSFFEALEKAGGGAVGGYNR